MIDDKVNNESARLSSQRNKQKMQDINAQPILGNVWKHTFTKF